MPEFSKRLRKESRSLAIARSLAALVGGFLFWSGLLVLLDLYDAFSPIRESEVLTWIYLVLGLSFVSFSGFLLRVWLNRPVTRKLAEEVESNHPHLQDLLHAGIEIEQSKSAPTFMEKRVLQALRERSAGIDWGKGLRPSSSFWAFLLLGFFLGLALSYWNAGRSPLVKAKAALQGDSGLRLWTSAGGALDGAVHPPDAEYRTGSDVVIGVEVLRGHRGSKRAWIEWMEENGTTRLGMVAGEDPAFSEFIFPSLTKSLRYRVVTPSLTSQWHRIDPYDPPELEFALWKVVPPAYLKADSFTHEGFGYLEAPEGSSLQMDVRVNEAPENVGARLLADEGNLSLEKMGRVTFGWTGRMDDEWSAKLSLSDLDHPDRPDVLHDAVIFSPIPDEAPIVEISEPAKDLELPFDSEPLLIEVFAADDHGVSDLRLHVSHDGVKREQELFVPPMEKEKAVTAILDLSEYPLAVGDALTYMAFAVDNKEPENQLARSEVYFIEILPPEGNLTDSMDQAGGMEGERKEIPVRAFINRTKQIIRENYDALIERGLEREKRSLALCAQALGLKNDMTKTYDEFDGMFPIVDGLDLGELLNEATYHMERTEIHTGEGELEKSLESNDKCYRKLVQLYALMQQLEKQKAKGQGQSSDSQGEQAEKNEEQEPAEENPNPQEQLRELAKQLEELKDLEKRQDELNDQVGQAAGRGQSGEGNRKLASEQEGIRRDLEELRQQRYDRRGRLGDVASLDQAEREMKEGSGDLRRDLPRQAQPHGELASEALGRAIAEVEAEMSQYAADMVDELTKLAEQLGNAQGNLKSKTENAQGGEGQRLRQEQESLNEGMEELLDKIDRTARSLGEFQERATEELLRAGRTAREKGMEKAGKRASNSLLYDAFERAEKEQGRLEDGLEELHGGLQKAEDRLRYGENSQLGEIAEHLNDMRARGSGMNEEEFRKANQDAAEALGNLPGSENDQRLLNLTRMFEESAISENLSNGRSLSAGAVDRATRLIEQFFWQRSAEQGLLRNHQATRAPARYRKQVQEYFRRIAEGE